MTPTTEFSVTIDQYDPIMSRSTAMTAADLADRHRQHFALAIFVVSLIYLAKAAEQLLPTGMAELLDQGSVILGLLVIGILALTFVSRLRLGREQKLVYFSEDGYVAQLLRRAFRVSWTATFLTLVALDLAVRYVGTGLPPNFFLQVGLFVMLSVMSTTFLLQAWIDFPGAH